MPRDILNILNVLTVIFFIASALALLITCILASITNEHIEGLKGIAYDLSVAEYYISCNCNCPNCGCHHVK